MSKLDELDQGLLKSFRTGDLVLQSKESKRIQNKTFFVVRTGLSDYKGVKIVSGKLIRKPAALNMDVLNNWLQNKKDRLRVLRFSTPTKPACLQASAKHDL